jgi:poly(A) polymerase Pap1
MVPVLLLLAYTKRQTGESWNKLFDKADFFSRYKIFVQVEVFADTEEHHLKWYAPHESLPSSVATRN